MENMNELNTTENVSLPVLKPLALKPEFVSKIKGDNRLKTNVIIVLARDEEHAYFLCCLLSKNEDQNNKNIININIDDGINDRGELKKIILAQSIDTSAIYKMDYNELISKLQTRFENMDELPYLTIKDQLNIVDKIAENVNNSANPMRLVLIRKKPKLDSNSTQI
ncbi:hypothetical protein [Mycoplasma tauri]|uniref:hypothetical protein n=1 Tax=Mycoplasma tauri TaxID=547987 RepID=UPI001E2B8EA4|nr:hypothetical protein [Mycoplasma tauri]